MITILFAVLLLSVVGKMIGFAFKAAWGITRIAFAIFLLPIVFIGMALAGFMYLALIILMIMMIGSFLGSLVKA